MKTVRRILSGWICAWGRRPVTDDEADAILAELDAARARVAELNDTIDAAHGLICNAHRKRVDDVTTDDGASPGWAAAARRWIDAYPPAR